MAVDVCPRGHPAAAMVLPPPGHHSHPWPMSIGATGPCHHCGLWGENPTSSPPRGGGGGTHNSTHPLAPAPSPRPRAQ